MRPRKRKFLYQSELAKNVANKYKMDPFEIDFLPEFEQGRGSRDAFVNEFGVVIGDHEYESDHSPLEQWSKETDPAIMSGDQWVHPYKDIGFHSKENRDYFEKKIAPQPGMFTHPTLDVTFNNSLVDTNEQSGTEEQMSTDENEWS